MSASPMSQSQLREELVVRRESATRFARQWEGWAANAKTPEKKISQLRTSCEFDLIAEVYGDIIRLLDGECPATIAGNSTQGEQK